MTGTSSRVPARGRDAPPQGALRIDAIELDATDNAPDRVRLARSVTVRILDADAVSTLSRARARGHVAERGQCVVAGGRMDSALVRSVS